MNPNSATIVANIAAGVSATATALNAASVAANLNTKTGLTSVSGTTAILAGVNVAVGGQGLQGIQGIQGISGVAGTNDKYFIQTFTSTASFSVAHNLAKYPSVTVFDSALNECEGQVVHIDTNNLTVSFSASFSGTVTCN